MPYSSLKIIHLVSITKFRNTKMDVVLNRPQDHFHGYTWTIIRRHKATHSREHAILPAWYYTRVRLLARIALHVPFPIPNHTSYTFSLSFNTDLSVGVLTCLQAPFVPPQRLIATALEAVTDHRGILYHRCNLTVLTGQILWR